MAEGCRGCAGVKRRRLWIYENNEKRIAASAVCTMVFTTVIMFGAIVFLDSEPQIPMLVCSFLAGCIGMVQGNSWEVIRKGMLDGIYNALESVIILLLLGILSGVWISSGVVPTLIYYGLRLISPRFFLLSTFVTCSLLSMALGSWGTAGTVGIAFMGIARTMGISLPLAAGAIISGVYVGDKWSPISDTNNLAASICGVPVMRSIRHMLKVSGPFYIVTAVIYMAAGLHFGNLAPGGMEEIARAADALPRYFSIGLMALLPLGLLAICMIKQVPAIPSIAVGIGSSVFYAVAFQHNSLYQMVHVAYGGYISGTGIDMIDSLLTTGGLESMMFSVGLIMTAMMFGGILEASGQMEALVKLILKLIKGTAGLLTATMITCLVTNMIMPDQYMAIAFPGRMYAEEYNRRGIDRRELTMAVGISGISTSALIPWNTCGAFMFGALGVKASDYLPFAFFNLIMIPVAVAYAMMLGRREKKERNI